MASNPQLRPADDGLPDAEAVAIAVAAPDPLAAASLPLADRLRRAWAGSLAILAVASCLLGWVFRMEIAAAVHVWWSSATFGHGFFILPFGLFLPYRRLHRLAARSEAHTSELQSPMRI